MITTALKIARDEMTVADLKRINRFLKEMRSAARIFAPFKHLQKVGRFRIGAKCARFTGIQNGDGFCVRNGQAGLHADRRVAARESWVPCSGGLGDMDAISYRAPAQVRLHFGAGFRVFQNQTRPAGRRRGDHAFYRVFHSARWVGERFSISLNHSLSNEALVDLNNHFRDILRTGEIVQRVAPGKENDDLETLDLPRLIFTPVRSRFGRFRQLIDAINSSPTT